MNTHTAILPRLPEMHWRRVGAISITLAFHLLAGLTLLLPTTPPLPMPRAAQEFLSVNFVEPTPKVEVPPVVVPVLKHVTQPIRKQTPTPQQPPVVDNTEPTPLSQPAVPTMPNGPTDIATPTGKTEGVSYLGSTRVTYPRDALRAHEQGTVLLHVLVGIDGIPQSIEIEKSSGSPRLDRAAREAVMRWHFLAAVENGTAKASWALVPVSFSLSNQ